MILSRTIPALKALGEGRFEGLAWSFAATPDTEGDILLPSALEPATKAVPIPVLVEHTGKPVGAIERAELSAEGLQVSGRFDIAAEAGRSAYALVKSGELAGLSIGFAGEAEQSGPVRIFKSAHIDEISVCRAPINSGSRVTAVKSWTGIGSERELERFLKSTGMPNRLASKLASAGWPVMQETPNPDPPAELLESLRRLANL